MLLKIKVFQVFNFSLYRFFEFLLWFFKIKKDLEVTVFNVIVLMHGPLKQMEIEDKKLFEEPTQILL